VVSIQGTAGSGKTHISLASAFSQILERKSKYSKIYIIKPNVEIGAGRYDLGFTPGSVQNKMSPYTDYLQLLCKKLSGGRDAKKIFDPTSDDGFNSDLFKILPIGYVRGMTLEDCIVICDEFQNVDRETARTVFSRLGENSKLIILGDTSQIDSSKGCHINEYNNGLNWAVKLFKPFNNYAHIVLKDGSVRSKICDMVNKSGL
jgi:PhoH-like ATPase